MSSNRKEVEAKHFEDEDEEDLRIMRSVNPIFSTIKAFMNEDTNDRDEFEKMKSRIDENVLKKDCEAQPKLDMFISRIFDRYET